MRALAFASLVTLAAVTIGCNRPIASEPPAQAPRPQQQAAKPPIPDEELRAVSAIKPGTKIDADAEADANPDADAITETLQAFHRACQARDADACLALYTDETREEVRSWFETDEVFDVAYKSSQVLWCDQRDIVVEVHEVDGGRAIAISWFDPSGHTPEEISTMQKMRQEVSLRKVNGDWLIDGPVLGRPASMQTQQVRKY